VRALHLVNSSVVNFDYAWDLGPNPRLAVRPERGAVPQGERVVFELGYSPHAPNSLSGYKISCQVGGTLGAVGERLTSRCSCCIRFLPDKCLVIVKCWVCLFVLKSSIKNRCDIT
jgi:hypothetical protein